MAEPRYNYPVTFRGPFPLDQLRFDEAWPTGSGDSAVIKHSLLAPHHPSRTVWLTSHKLPTLPRWERYECIVGEVSFEENNNGL
jgi:hypothetical protein